MFWVFVVAGTTLQLRCAGFSLWWLLSWPTGLVTLRHVGPSQTRGQTCVSCIGRQVLYHWGTKEAHKLLISVFFDFSLFSLMIDTFVSCLKNSSLPQVYEAILLHSLELCLLHVILLWFNHLQVCQWVFECAIFCLTGSVAVLLRFECLCVPIARSSAHHCPQPRVPRSIHRSLVAPAQESQPPTESWCLEGHGLPWSMSWCSWLFALPYKF